MDLPIYNISSIVCSMLMIVGDKIRYGSFGPYSNVYELRKLQSEISIVSRMQKCITAKEVADCSDDFVNNSYMFVKNRYGSLLEKRVE